MNRRGTAFLEPTSCPLWSRTSHGVLLRYESDAASPIILVVFVPSSFATATTLQPRTWLANYGLFAWSLKPKIDHERPLHLPAYILIYSTSEVHD